MTTLAGNAPSLTATLQQAAQLLSQRNAIGAETLLRNALAVWPAEPDVITLLGSTYEQAGHADHAESLYRHSLSLKPTQPFVAARLGHILHSQGRFREAVGDFQNAISLEPRHADAHHGLAVSLQQLRRFDEALESFDRARALLPQHPGILTNRGRLLTDMKRFADALECFGQALAVKPDLVEAYINRGVVLQLMNRREEALADFSKAMALEPGNAVAWSNHATALQSLGRFADSITSFRNILALRPENAAAHNGIGISLQKLGRHEEALVEFDEAVALADGYAQAWSNRGVALQALGRFRDALASYEKALAVQPNHPVALANINLVLSEGGLVEEAFAAFTRNAQAARGGSRISLADEAQSAHKLRHDREQRDYLATIRPDAQAADGLLFHLADGGRVTEAVNPTNATAALAEKWRNERPQIVAIDNFLTPEALDKLRRFCLESTVWEKVYADGYLGAMPENGFACPLLAQIAEELRRTFPEIFADHALRYVWAFKYDSRLSGIDIHADKAAVNVNFWITPDEANLNPEGGGLVVWDIAAPLDWDFDRYNGDVGASREFIKRSGARPITVPYRANRAVIFDSDLFHKTDDLAFKEGYLNRRINVTLLFGKRAAEAAESVSAAP